MLNDLPGKIQSGKVTISLLAGKEQITLLTWDYNPMPPNTNQTGPTARYQLPFWPVDRFMVVLEVEGHPEFNSEYTLAYKPAIGRKEVP
jgi:hypothetical protein